MNVTKLNVKKKSCSVLLTQLMFIKCELTGYIPASSSLPMFPYGFGGFGLLKKCSFMRGHICCVLDQ